MVAIQSMLRNSGIKVELEGSEPKVLYNYLRTGDFQVGDAGWIADFNDASNFIYTIENRQGLKIACLEEISLKNKWIGKKDIQKSIKFYGNCDYSRYLKKL